ncbi:MAG: sodium:proton antiporter [Gemmatimonadales bacterium]
MPLEPILILLFIVATAVAIVARRLRLPYTIALVLAGLGLGQLHAFEAPHLTQELLFAVFLPGLLFEAAFHLDFAGFRRDMSLTLALAVPGVLAAILLTAAILMGMAALLPLDDALTWARALVFGALVAATDPIAVVGLFRTLGAPHRLSALLEGESLLNDGTAIVFFGLILGIVGGGTLSMPSVILDFVRVVGLGAGIGFLVGLVVSTLVQRIDDPMIEITLTTIAAYGAFSASELLHGSGVIATVVAGMLCGNYGARTGMSPTTRVAVESFWEYVAFALNSIIFLLIGFEVRLPDLLAAWQVILAASLAVLAGRAIVVYLVAGVFARGRASIPSAWRPVLSWGGLRGGLSMVLALSLPESFPNRGLMIAVTFGVVLLSILVQGLTMGPLLRRLGLARDTSDRTAYDQSRGDSNAATAALAEIDRMIGTGQTGSAQLAEVRAEYEARQHRAREALEALRSRRGDLHTEDLRRARRHLLMIEKAQTLEAVREGLLDRTAADRLLTDVDGRLLHLEERDQV